MTLNQSTPNKPSFKFEMNDDAARHNESLLNKYGYDLSRAIAAQKNSTMSFGSEFKPIETLRNIYKNHPDWPKMQEFVKKGVSYPMSKLDEQKRQQRMTEMLN